jgi:hypothetical protein
MSTAPSPLAQTADALKVLAGRQAMGKGSASVRAATCHRIVITLRRPDCCRTVGAPGADSSWLCTCARFPLIRSVTGAARISPELKQTRWLMPARLIIANTRIPQALSAAIEINFSLTITTLIV